ncbi:hypothetical protein MKW94_027340, partial [Papaver nudicaule]|nr:hypothetical protein [Papaver nudicaule]
MRDMKELQVSLNQTQKVRLQSAIEQLEKLPSKMGSSASASITAADTKVHGTSEVDGEIVATLCEVVE